ncbi:MAG: 16S rRNA (guanine(527)-N(7))-methyltransferase RsmG [Pseudomonadota bacterium]
MPDFMKYPFAGHGLDVSRETREKFNRYAELLLKWQKAVNLVGDSTLEDMAERHFLDSAQLVNHIPDKQVRLADMGSGAGFPGMVLAMMGVSEVHLIESDVRKATFLREVSRETQTKVFVHDDRVENTIIPDLDFVTARALAPLRDLLTMAGKLSTPHRPYTCLFMKGEKTDEEVVMARKRWNFKLETFPSITSPEGKILKISNINRLG